MEFHEKPETKIVVTINKVPNKEQSIPYKNTKREIQNREKLHLRWSLKYKRRTSAEGYGTRMAEVRRI